MADNNTPTWLQPETTTAQQPVMVEATPAPLQTEAASTPTTGDTGSDEADLPSIILTMRLANMGVSVAMVVISVRQKDLDQ